nr:MAG TPA: hypothetical protein [Caudoviricetes sp.]
MPSVISSGSSSIGSGSLSPSSSSSSLPTASSCLLRPATAVAGQCVSLRLRMRAVRDTSSRSR